MKKGNRTTLIYQKNNIVQEVNQTIERFLNQFCLKDLTTLNGRIQAISEVYHIRKQIPIYLSNKLILIQIANKKEIDNLYINSYNIVDIIEDNNNTIIYFSDLSKIKIEKPYHLIKKYYNTSIRIRK